MEEITEIILLDNGFKNDGTDVFSYIGNDYSIDIYYTIPIKERSWFCVIYTNYTNSIRYVLAAMAIQTIEQFNHLMDIVEINFKLENYEEQAKSIH